MSEYAESPFEKCGRIFIEGDDLVIRSDLDDRGFCIPLVDVVDVLDGETVPVLLLENRTQVGVAKRSTSGKAMNVWIDPLLYTSPLSRVMDVLEGRARKAAVFVGREEGGVNQSGKSDSAISSIISGFGSFRTPDNFSARCPCECSGCIFCLEISLLEVLRR
ncbi:MAG: hypothetical protein A4E40_01035 [Methanoregulaceae archaeon PtaU1.Bin059]|nr:MAG: hypothetical protein A4E37_00146 [Methanoregulaceae archaeon PtaB.Bin056]OPY39649.1 MAG: hypothetical protein A4E40_01035 [Methanoregulaceae archaeon PtaU1.Bin059]